MVKVNDAQVSCPHPERWMKSTNLNSLDRRSALKLFNNHVDEFLDPTVFNSNVSLTELFSQLATQDPD